eukprot:2068906-Rhodomonas_salina.4
MHDASGERSRQTQPARNATDGDGRRSRCPSHRAQDRSCSAASMAAAAKSSRPVDSAPSAHPISDRRQARAGWMWVSEMCSRAG